MKKSIKSIIFVLCLIVLFFALDSTKKSSAAETISEGTYKISSAIDEDYVLDITGASTDDCANLEIWSRNLKDNQSFKIKSVGNGYYTISVVNSGKYLDVDNAGKSNGTNVLQFRYNGNDNQKWLIKSAGNGYYYIVSKCSGLYLDIEGGIIDKGTNIITWKHNGGLNQQFKLEKIDQANIKEGKYRIASAVNENYVLDITGASTKDCANLELWNSNAKDNQSFEIKSDGNGYYTISAVNSGKYLDVDNAGKSNGTNILQFKYTGGDNQKWMIRPTGNGYYNIVSKCNGLCLDIENALIDNGANISTWEKSNEKAQKFTIERVEQYSVSEGTYKIASAMNENYVLDVTGASDENNANIELWTDNEQNNQKYIIRNIGNGYYSIECCASEKYLSVDDKKNGANVEQHNLENADNQKWIIKSVGSGYYSIISKYNGEYIDIFNKEIKQGTNINTWVYNGGNNQKFKLVPTKKQNSGRSEDFKKQHPEIKVGIDVSYFQGKIDWSAVKKDGIDYAMIRAGFRGYGSSGSLNEDSMFDENVKGARAAGLDVGVYFFSQAKNYDEGVKEAQYTIEMIKKYDITYPVAFDTEASSSPTNTGRADNISVQERTDATRGFCETIERAGYKTLIYASSYWLETKLDLSQLSKYKIWLANYTGATQEDPLNRPSSYKGDYVMWQYTSSGTVEGIGGNVDCDIYYYLKDK